MQVLDVALHAYWTGDPADVSVNAICQAAGVSKPSVYRAFGSEDGLTRATIDLYVERILQPLLETVQSDATFADKREALISFAADAPETATGCLYVKMRAVRAQLGPDTQARLAALDNAAFAVHRQMLETAASNDEWRAQIPLDQAAHYSTAQMSLALTQRAAGVAPEDVRALLTLAFSVFD